MYLTSILHAGIPDKIVVADDYGVSAKVNAAILDEAHKGNVHIVSILANMVSTDDLSRLVKTPGILFAIHANVIEGRPVSEPSEIPSLVTKNGEFHSLPIFILRLMTHQIRLDDVITEIHNQITVLRSHHIPIDYFNSHQHALAFPQFYKTVQDLCQQEGVKYFRGHESVFKYFTRKPLKLVFFLLFCLLYARGKKQPNLPKVPNEVITHPGAPFDARFY